MSKAYQVVGIGNAVSDVIAISSDEFLAENGVEKGIMQLVDQPRAEALFAAMEQPDRNARWVCGQYDCRAWIFGSSYGFYRTGCR